VTGNEGMQRIEPSSPVYQEVARLHPIAKQMRPSGLDRWNGELYARFDDKWGGLGRDGTMQLNQEHRTNRTHSASHSQSVSTRV
jgi:hypothetical protein